MTDKHSALSGVSCSPAAKERDRIGRAETRAVLQIAKACKDDMDEIGVTSRAVMARWIIDHLSASPSQEDGSPRLDAVESYRVEPDTDGAGD